MRRAGAGLAVSLSVSLSLFAGCGKLTGFGGPVPPLVTFQLMVTGDLAPFRPPNVTSERDLRVALVWGAQWLTEPFCVLPAESTKAGDVIAAGCRDPFGFVPIRVAANVQVSIGQTATLPLYDLPSADVMVGDVTARVAYGSLVVYDDDGTGTLELASPHRTNSGGNGPPMEDTRDSSDIVYGASFVSMTAPDQRIAFREGAFNAAAAFYPRSGCPAPPPGFSVLSAGGFSLDVGLAAAATGQLPPEDPSACAQTDPTATVISIPVAAPVDVREVSCVERTDDSSTRYREPPADPPDFSDRTTACAHLPSFDAGNQSSLIQLVVSGRLQDRCEGLTHYVLRGCRQNVACTVPDWDFTATPPAWWPCPN
jgi:hypothetical protein